MTDNIQEEQLPVDAPEQQLEGGTYELIRNRLRGQGEELRGRLEKLNAERKEVFGSIDSRLLNTDRITTEHNCLPQDMVPIGNLFIFGYNVHIGLKSETSISDVLSVYRYSDHAFHLTEPTLLQNREFEDDFRNLYKYYKKTRFVKFSVIGPYLYMAFQIGRSTTDIKTFKWLIRDNALEYVDNRSEHEFRFPAQQEVDWKRATRDFHRDGDHPHVSIADRLFVESIGGDLTIKIEDNTDSGEGIYAEPVDHKEQLLDDAEIFYALAGDLILLKIKPFQEKNFRYLVYSEKNQQVRRADSIQDSCIFLPDDHGIVFAKGYVLQSGTFKLFEHELQNIRFEKQWASPNGEDHLFVFFQPESGTYVLLRYNVIAQAVDVPLLCSGYAHFENGEMVYFRAEETPGKHHAAQIWQTPFVSPEYNPPVKKGSYLYKIGNKDIVRCMSECQEVYNLAFRDDSYANLYVDIVKKSRDILDSYFWLTEPKAQNLSEPLQSLHDAGAAALAEFDKVERLRRTAREELLKVKKQTEAILEETKRPDFKTVDKYVEKLTALRTLRGELISLRDVRYIDLKAIEALEDAISERSDMLSAACVEFLLKPNALEPYGVKVAELDKRIPDVSKVAVGKVLAEDIDKVAAELEMLIEVVSNLKIDDATQTTEIVDSVSTIYSTLNQTRARLRKRISSLQSTEAIAEFNAQIKLLGQGLINYLDLCETPEKCDEYLTRLMVQLEELEGRFADFDDFILQLSEKREEIYGAFELRKIMLVESRNKRASTLQSAAERILKGIQNRLSAFDTTAAINGYLASDLMVDKVRDIIEQLTNLGDTIKADDIQTRLKTLREDTVRQLKDKKELFVDGENVIKMGERRFSVNTMKPDLTILPHEDGMALHLTGTRFFEALEDAVFLETRPVWKQEVVSESADVYRAEYLAWQILQDVVQSRSDTASLAGKKLLPAVQKFMNTRFEEGYVKGVHDADAALFLKSLLKIEKDVGLLRSPPEVRACAMVFWLHFADSGDRDRLAGRLSSVGEVLNVFPESAERQRYIDDLSEMITIWLEETGLYSLELAKPVARCLFEQLVSESDSFVISHEGSELYGSFMAYLNKKRARTAFDKSLKRLEKDALGRITLLRDWLIGYAESLPAVMQDGYVEEVVALLFCDNYSDKQVKRVSVRAELNGFLGEHSVLQDNTYSLDYHAFNRKLEAFHRREIPLFQRYLKLKKERIEAYREEMHLEDFTPRVLTSFVRNKLIDQLYLPLIGDNLAKQIGETGAATRTDRMGMLLLISPPGYGKTTLMEYVANRLGLILMKINGPAIGHHVTSLDPAEAPNAAAREEVEKLNLSLEFGDNVMIYLDDIQHCNPEFLQKFISLCDAQRKIEGVYKGRSRTYDLRGRKVCVVMAGNPYTESGEAFKIPDMLANRADTYNLGDILGDNADIFKLSYLENSLTSNSILSKLANKEQEDIYSLIRFAESGDREQLKLEGSYSADEVKDYVAVFQRLLRIRDVILRVNQEYIRSAGQADAYRTEPPFKLQGSYRNMNKLAEKVIPVMNKEELELLIASHYEQEAQTLTTGAEANLLKFREINELLSDEDAERWADIKKTFTKNRMFGGNGGSDRMAQLLAQLDSFGDGLDGIREVLEKAVNAKPKTTKRKKTP
ncbi:MAG: DNA repair ATPase [Calditrichia bacterium]